MPSLPATLTRVLDVRFFPLAARGGERLDLDDQVRNAVSNMTALESLVWTASPLYLGLFPRLIISEGQIIDARVGRCAIDSPSTSFTRDLGAFV